jgi:SagB-type dehydrogenase family enzyme
MTAAVLAGTTTTVVRLRRDASAAASGTGLVITSRFCELRLRDLPAGVRAALVSLAGAGATQEALAESVMTSDGDAAVMRLQMVMLRLDAEGLLERGVLADGAGSVAWLRPVGRGRTSWGPRLDPSVPVKLSRFAIAGAEDGVLVVRAPGSHLAVDLALPACSLLGALAGWRGPEAVARLTPSLPQDAVGEVLRLFQAAGLLVVGQQELDPESARPETAQWAPADLWLHARSRGPGTVAGYGGTYPNAGRSAPLPASPPPRGTRGIALTRPDMPAIARRDPPLSQVIESRRSIREHDDADPITLGQLGELLFRCARRVGTCTGADGQELASRPYPSGGALHELEVYPLVTACRDLEPGLWHYRADAHELELAAAPGPATRALVASARAGALMTSDPQVTLLVSARFGRIMWKYETVGYPLILKHVGVLYQTLYLVGTAMGLAVCGLGGGDAAEFARATGLDYLAEGTVGELVVGSRPAVLRHPSGVPTGDEEAWG